MNIENTGERSPSQLEWRVHLMQADPRRMPVVLLAMSAAAISVWIMFRSWLPAAAALLLLAGAIREYLFPMTYRITTEGAFVHGILVQNAIEWDEVRRILPDGASVILTPLPVPSRLDAFRGVCIRFAPPGQQGDRASVMEIIGRHAKRVETGPGSINEGA